MKPKPPAVEDLRRWLTVADLTYDQLAEALGVTRAAVQNWMVGQDTPKLETAVVLESLTGGAVLARSWAAPAAVKTRVAEAREALAVRKRPQVEPRWYLSAKAIREYLGIVGRPDDDGGPEWARAERELAGLCDQAHPVGETRSGMQRWRTPSPLRLQLIVSTEPRREGPQPQLVGVLPATGSRPRSPAR